MRRPYTLNEFRGKFSVSFRLLAKQIELVLLVTRQSETSAALNSVLEMRTFTRELFACGSPFWS